MTIVLRRNLALLAAGALVACGGGGGGSSAPAALPGTSSTPVAAVSTAPPLAMTSTRFTITVPSVTATSALARKPAYVSPATQSVIITLVSVNGSPYGGSPNLVASNLTTGNPNCSGTPLTCTVTAPAVAGNDVFSVATYDTVQSSVTPSSPAGHVLSQADLTVTVAANQVTTVTTPLTLNGVADHLDITTGSPSVSSGTATSVAVSVNVRDKQNNIIVGSGGYVDANGNPLTIHLTDSDASGLTSVTPSSITGPTAVSLNYTGTLPATSPLAANIGATVSGGTLAGAVTPAAFSVVVPLPTITAMSNVNWVTSDAPSAYTETLTGTNFTAATTVQATGLAGVSIASVNVTSATSLTAIVTVAAGTAQGSASVTATTIGGTSVAQTLNIVDGLIVTDNSDTNTVAAFVSGFGPGNPGDLRYSLQNTPVGGLIVFNCGSPCTITLGGPLPPIDQDLTIDGGAFGNTIIDGASSYRGLFVQNGNVTLENVQIQNVAVIGGYGGNDGGGGGFGAGAGLYIEGGGVTLANDYFLNCAANGGNGGAGTGLGQGGGGGMGALSGSNFVAGGQGASQGGGAGGGGMLDGGFFSVANNGGGGGGGASATGGANGFDGAGGNSGAAWGTDATPAGGTGPGADGGDGGNGSFGGGGGAGGYSGGVPGGFGGNGGFGGGGGGGGAAGSGNGGNGGFGGAGAGGGGGGPAAGGNGGISGLGGALIGGTVSGGNGGAMNNGGSAGGGGAAAGPAIFIETGTVTITNSGVSGVSANGGAGGTSSFSASANGGNGGADATPVWNNAGTLNGQSGSGAAPGVLLVNTMPSAHARSMLAPQSNGQRRRPLSLPRLPRANTRRT